MDTFLLPAMKFWCRLWAGLNKSYLLGCIEICKSWMALCQSVRKEEQRARKSMLKYPSWSHLPKISESRSSVFLILLFRIFPFLSKTKAERSSGAMSPLTQNLQYILIFCKPINSRPYEGLLTVFHHLKVTLLLFVCMVPLSRCPFGRTCYGKTCTFSLCTMH